MYDLQRADMWKRISAWLFDFILLGIVIVGAAWGLSAALKYDTHWEALEACYDKYEQEYGISFDITEEQRAELTEEQLAKYKEAGEKMQEDATIRVKYTLVVNLILIITSCSILIGHVIMEFVIPLAFGNGQTLGKKIFGIGVMRLDGVKVTPLQMFVRSILGKCTVETLVPVFCVITVLLKVMGIIGIAVMAAILLSQIVLVFATKTHTPIHDVMAGTVTVDMASQMIFDTPEELIAYKQRIHQEEVSNMREESLDFNSNSK